MAEQLANLVQRHILLGQLGGRETAEGVAADFKTQFIAEPRQHLAHPTIRPRPLAAGRYEEPVVHAPDPVAVFQVTHQMGLQAGIDVHQTRFAALGRGNAKCAFGEIEVADGYIQGLTNPAARQTKQVNENHVAMGNQLVRFPGQQMTQNALALRLGQRGPGNVVQAHCANAPKRIFPNDSFFP